MCSHRDLLWLHLSAQHASHCPLREVDTKGSATCHNAELHDAVLRAEHGMGRLQHLGRSLNDVMSFSKSRLRGADMPSSCHTYMLLLCNPAPPLQSNPTLTALRCPDMCASLSVVLTLPDYVFSLAERVVATTVWMMPGWPPACLYRCRHTPAP